MEKVKHNNAKTKKVSSELPTFLPISQIVEQTGISYYTVRKWVHDGCLPFIRTGNKIFIEKNVLCEFLKGRTQIQEDKERGNVKWKHRKSL